MEWDKGHALAHLLGALGLDGAKDVLPIYIGDDRCAARQRLRSLDMQAALPVVWLVSGSCEEPLAQQCSNGGCEEIHCVQFGTCQFCLWFCRTDEDAFRLLSRRQQGFGILVSSRVRRSPASLGLHT